MAEVAAHQARACGRTPRTRVAVPRCGCPDSCCVANSPLKVAKRFSGSCKRPGKQTSGELLLNLVRIRRKVQVSWRINTVNVWSLCHSGSRRHTQWDGGIGAGRWGRPGTESTGNSLHGRTDSDASTSAATNCWAPLFLSPTSPR